MFTSFSMMSTSTFQYTVKYYSVDHLDYLPISRAFCIISFVELKADTFAS